MQKRKQTENLTCIKLGPGRLGAWMETYQPPPRPVRLLYTVETRVERHFWGEGHDTVILGNRRNL
jgi:hypothetical protein